MFEMIDSAVTHVGAFEAFAVLLLLAVCTVFLLAIALGSAIGYAARRIRRWANEHLGEEPPETKPIWKGAISYKEICPSCGNDPNVQPGRWCSWCRGYLEDSRFSEKR